MGYICEESLFQETIKQWPQALVNNHVYFVDWKPQIASGAKCPELPVASVANALRLVPAVLNSDHLECLF